MLIERGLRHGIALYHRSANRGEYGDLQRIAPPLVSTRDEIGEMVGMLGAALCGLQVELQRTR